MRALDLVLGVRPPIERPDSMQPPAELAEFRPVLYTGTESAKQKSDAKRAFIVGETDLFMMSLRSGAGLWLHASPSWRRRRF